MSASNAALKKHGLDAAALNRASDDAGRVGSVISVTGSHALVMLDPAHIELDRLQRPQIGAIMSVDAGQNVTLGLVSAMSVPAPSLDEARGEMRIIELELIGEFSKPTAKSPARFRRGVSAFPTLGDSVHVATRDELGALFRANNSLSVRIGVVKQDSAIPATVSVNDLLSRHCAIVGTTGSGKSCAVALMLRAILDRYHNGHVVLLDPYNEYAHCFGELAMVFGSKNFSLPYWMLTFDEFVEVLYPERVGYKEEIDILADLIPAAKKIHFTATASARITADRRGEAAAITVDTPTPYRISDVLMLIDKALGGLDSTRSVGPYKRLRARIFTLSQDTRYAFMFGGLTVQDTMASFLSSLFRIPVEGRPISIIELGGLPEEVAQVVVSVTARLAFEFGLWSNGAAPIAIVCEDAHRYAPANKEDGFAPTRKALVRLAKEGRKVGVSLWLVSQRPTELDPTILSQCNTIFAMRLANHADQDALRAGAPDASTSLLNCLPSLGLGEAVAIGEGVPLPTRIRFDSLPREAIPRRLAASFTDGWSVDAADAAFVERIVEQWRAQRLLTPQV